LYNKIIELESRIEGQEQYSRRTSLRFHNIKVPADERGNVKHPVNTDEQVFVPAQLLFFVACKLKMYILMLTNAHLYQNVTIFI
jgi:hypothetical protein